MKLHQSLKSKVSFLLLLAVLAGIIPMRARAQDGDPNALVEVEVPQDILADYRSRRGGHGWYFALMYEPYTPKNYTSVLDGQSYDTLFGGEAVPLIGLDVDYKFNMDIGAFAVGLSYSAGSISDSRSGDDRSLDLTKTALNVRLVADMLMPEPYVAPYVGVSLYQMSVTDKNSTTSASKSAGTAYAYTLGVLLQLDALDYEAAKKATFSIGLENTFIDIFVTQYAKAGDDPDFGTDTLFGGGLRLEF